ncbi:polycomb protein Pcl [Onthophagus taurus]|uniref:polycomb protein Pcl n=1 Tax=Onthophagus taurus TaxID=166361 RepID=UPI000C1FDBE0|nr:polycomb protein Pcl [Onthophagus taurus]
MSLSGNVRVKRKETANEESVVVPDSTTIVEKDATSSKWDFAPGQDVLLKQKDGRFYLGTIVEVDPIREQCLVKFGDDTDSWSGFKDLTKLSAPEQEVLCVICKKSAPKNKHEVTVCDKCGRGYHQKCHQPEIPNICQKEGGGWVCRRCIQQEPLLRQRRPADFKGQQQRRDSVRKICSNSETIRKTLPYNIDDLTWDTYHRVNSEQLYCYCGSNGEWYTQMLQCGRCRQWFHERCIGPCLQYPLYCGDRFYVFVCSVCNQGVEFLRRLELKWVDLVHLMLFNLTAYNSKKYYDLDTIIVPYINDNWHALQLPPKIFNVSKCERRENILSVLTNNRNRFKCGREIKKRTTIWGLRIRLPPPAPCVTLPLNGPIVEDDLRERWQGNRRLQFLPTQQIQSTAQRIVPTDNQMLNVMKGLAYQQDGNGIQSETESPCPSPDESPLDTKLFKVEYGGGCAKRSVPFPKTTASLSKQKKRMIARDKMLRRQQRRKNDGKRKTRTLSFGASGESGGGGKRRGNEVLPLTPPTSVSAPPTPPAGSSLFLDSDFAEMGVLSTSKRDKKNLISSLDTPCDTSGDETSSKSTLDLIIPPPKDFEGKNNPFLTLMKTCETVGKKRRSRDITLPLPLTAVIPVVRTMKRQLSEKDICIGPNGEVKRRRLRRNRAVNAAIPIYQTASKTATVLPVRTDAKEWGQRNLRSVNNQPQTTTTAGSGNSPQSMSNCVDYALNGRRQLRQRQQDRTNVEKDKIMMPSSNTSVSNPSTPKPSPVKQESDISMDDLKSSVNSYFGAGTRIAAGERFNVKAKRIGPTGKMEYLIEWEGPGNGMT